MEQSALIVAHGSPSNPEQGEADMEQLAARVAVLLPGWLVKGVTLAAPGRLEAAVAELCGPVVYPFFMAGGWFTKVELPRRLEAAGSGGLSVRAPFGESAAVTELAVDAAVSEAARQGWRADEVSLVLAAHGSGRSRVPAEAAGRIETAVRAAGRFAEVRLGFIEEAPSVAAVAAGLGDQAICLPLFVARWGHVVTDVPEALAEAGFRGVLLPPIGCRDEVPALIAAALRAG
jgi:sirohydrochlorin ferrochelatase